MTSLKIQEIAENIDLIKRRIEKSCIKAGRNPKDVKLVLATKTVPAELIKTCIINGDTLFAENKIQELLSKIDYLKGLDYTSHFIGHLQTNKVKQVIKHVNSIHSLDRLSLAKELNKRLARNNQKMRVLVQVNTSRETSKFGINPEDLPCFLEEINTFPAIYVEGLMTIGKFSSSEKEIRPCFQLLKQLADETDCSMYERVELKELSMGMSNDFDIAIEEGSTMVRIGTAIFGERKYPDSYYWKE
ncbi:MAG: YggS family pyridoxal phosphate-dependent enzyme [Crocinitomicaceae bacterium]